MTQRKFTVLMVDDEPNILSGLRRSLQPLRNEWESLFAGGGAEALAILDARQVDVVVSDMRMPGMDGAALLEEVARRRIPAARIILSGFAGENASLRLAKLVHLFLHKPCDPLHLQTVLRRLHFLYSLPMNPAMRESLAGLSSLPVFPKLYQKLIETLNDPDSSVQEVGQIIGQDLSMTAKVLQLVNSAFFGLPRIVNRAEEAVKLLGLSTVKNLVLGVGIFAQFEGVRVDEGEIDRQTRHGLAVAMLAKRLAREVPGGSAPGVAEEAFLAGMLHDLGKLILNATFPNRYDEQLGENGGQLCEVELRSFGIHHCLAGAFLLGLWGLPESVMNVAAFHHYPGESPLPRNPVLIAVHVADGVVNNTEAPIGDQMNTAYLAALGCDALAVTGETLYRQMQREGTL